ncbi:metallohydrolase [Sphingomonas flavalba]|uniref:metallohydrolase n=1 Tax=Sphingomonas flavalba TaxID=2559804 RepID=UPI0039E1828E
MWDLAAGILACILVAAATESTPEAAARAANPAAPASAVVGQALAPWSEGYLDIHHINTGRGNAAFFIFPDGTSMIFDAGALEDDWGRNVAPLVLGLALPNPSRRPGEWIADYIDQFKRPGMAGIDYALISHFHADHYGRVQFTSPASAHGNWKLAGITDVAERWPLGTLIDRDYPAYDFPVAQRGTKDKSLSNYFRFADGLATSGRSKVERFAVGRDDQIVLKYDPERYPTFSVRNIAANGAVWTGSGSASRNVLDVGQIADGKGKFNENPLSLMIRLDYGDFDYVTGGDTTGVHTPDQPEWFDMESKIAPVVGEVDALSLNHHGNRDATNADWLRALQPRIIVQQTWTSDHPGGDVVARITSKTLWPGQRDIFATHIQEPTKIAIGPWLTRNYRSMDGHVVIRVQPGGGAYDVYILDDRSTDRKVKAHFGPYQSRQ